MLQDCEQPVTSHLPSPFLYAEVSRPRIFLAVWRKIKTALLYAEFQVMGRNATVYHMNGSRNWLCTLDEPALKKGTFPHAALKPLLQ